MDVPPSALHLLEADPDELPSEVSRLFLQQQQEIVGRLGKMGEAGEAFRKEYDRMEQQMAGFEDKLSEQIRLLEGLEAIAEQVREEKARVGLRIKNLRLLEEEVARKC
jgi:hypothetical protein